MKICYLGNAATFHLLRWANYFAENGWQVDIITWHPPIKGMEIHKGVNIHRIFFPPHYVARYGTLLEVAWLMRKINPDIIHAHYLSHFGILGALYGKCFGFKPLVLTAWGSDVLVDICGWLGWTIRPLVKFAISRADAITCDADHMVAVLKGLGADPRKIQLIYFGTDTQKFKPGPKDNQLAETLGVADSPVVISLRSLRPIYDIKSLVEAIPLVLEAVPEARFIIAGDGEQKPYLEKLAEELGVINSVGFVGMIANDELTRHLTLAHVYVSTSLSDAGLSASTAEAMACGLPVVVTDFGDNSKWVADDVNGFLVPIRNPEALAAKIIYLLQHEDKRKEFGLKNRQIIEERDNRDKEMFKVEQMYVKLIERYKEVRVMRNHNK